MDDVDFVLGSFSKDEQQKLEKDVIPHTLTLINDFLKGNLEKTSHTLG
jgi:peptidyl-tRNA hydrolase